MHMLLVAPTGPGHRDFSPRVSQGTLGLQTSPFLPDGRRRPIRSRDSFFSSGSEVLRADGLGRPQTTSLAPRARPGPYGTSAFFRLSTGLPADGNWSLYVYDDGMTDQGEVLWRLEHDHRGRPVGGGGNFCARPSAPSANQFGGGQHARTAVIPVHRE